MCVLFLWSYKEKELFPNRRFSGCNLMRQSSNPKRDQFIRNIYRQSSLKNTYNTENVYVRGLTGGAFSICHKYSTLLIVSCLHCCDIQYLWSNLRGGRKLRKKYQSIQETKNISHNYLSTVFTKKRQINKNKIFLIKWLCDWLRIYLGSKLYFCLPKVIQNE